jgi:hypothetical protein
VDAISDVRRWTVWSKARMECLYSDGEVYSQTTSVPANVQCSFLSEADAYEAIYIYYWRHNKDFPYDDEWATAIEKESTNGTPPKTIESCVMEF